MPVKRELDPRIYCSLRAVQVVLRIRSASTRIPQNDFRVPMSDNVKTVFGNALKRISGG